ncbi:MAG TPA: hypothetical protein VFL63_12350, partial [Rhodanobacteraceae bacterium]|nr:hypothetical protein [Rhodanobacteraceae bacterium]
LQRVPDLVIELGMSRIDDAIASGEWAMYPLGRKGEERGSLDLMSRADGPLLLRTLLDRALGRIEDYKFSHRFAELMKSLCGPYGASFVATLENWLAAGTASHFMVVTAILREAGALFIHSNEGFIARALKGARCVGTRTYRDLSSAIFATGIRGVRSGRPGEPFDADVRLKEMAEQRLERIANSDASYDLYHALKDHADREIAHQLEEGRKMDEEDADA